MSPFVYVGGFLLISGIAGMVWPRCGFAILVLSGILLILS